MSNKRRGKKEDSKALPRPETGLRVTVDEEIDLHGLAIDEALVQADMALSRYHGRAGAVLRFIHGHSSGLSGSIKGALKRNLETVWKGRIGSFRGEPGNPGCTLVKVA